MCGTHSAFKNPWMGSGYTGQAKRQKSKCYNHILHLLDQGPACLKKYLIPFAMKFSLDGTYRDFVDVFGDKKSQITDAFCWKVNALLIREQ
jgi:hypothetical protein